MIPLADVRAHDQARVGHKAAILGELLAAGLPVPPGYCLTTLTAAEVRAQGALPDEVRAFLASLPQEAPYAVRSSSPHEGTGAFSGIFETILGARGVDSLARAVVEVVRSAGSGRAQTAYDSTHVEAGPLAMPVLLQPLLASEVSGVLLSRDPGRSEFVRVEAVPGSGDSVVDGQAQPERSLIHRSGGARAEGSRPHASGWLLSDAELHALALLARQVEELLGADPVEIEWARAHGTLWLLQARRAPGAAEERALFLWDQGHNPGPLSEAQSEVVRGLDERERVPFRLRVRDGYLFLAPRPGARIVSPRLTPDFAEFFEEEIAPKILGPVLEAPRNLDEAIKRFHRFCEEYFCGILSGPRQVLDELKAFLQKHEVWPGYPKYPNELPSQDPLPVLMAGLRTKTFRKEAALFAAATMAARSEGARRTFLEDAPPGADPVAQNVSAVLQEYLGFYGDEAPGWDVMCKTLREDAVAWREAREARLAHQGPSPEERRRNAARGSAELARALSEALPEDERRIFADKLTYARLLYPLLEEDDLLFSKAIAYLRRAFLQEGKKLGLADGEDVFFLSAEERRAKLSPEELKSRAEERRALWRQRALRPPLPPAPQAASGLRGEGASPGVVRGRVRVLLDFTAPRFSPGEILVVPALSPALSHILIFAAGLVAEHGGALSHAASMAREYGIPAVVGAAGATRLLHDGQHITIDGRTGAISLDEA